MPPNRSSWGHPLLCPATLALAACTSTASPETEAMLRLVEAMSGAASTDSVEVLPGTAPPDAGPLPDLPPGDRVVGSIRGPGRTHVFVSTSVAADSVGPVYARRLASEGWRWAAMPGGLASSGWIREELCHDDGKGLSLIYGEDEDGDVSLELRFTEAEPGSCPADIDAPMGFTSIPRLRPPPGIEVGGGCRPGDGWRGGASPVLSDAPDPLAPYRDQMEAAGWRGTEEPTGSTARSWTRADDRGRPIRVTLAVTDGGGPSASCRTLTFTAGLHR